MSDSLHPEETVTSIIWVRHGHTVQTEQGKLYYNPQTPLTERGKNQALLAAQFLQKEKPNKLLCSSSIRTQETAKIIAQELSLEVEIISGLEEQSIGEWEGRSYLDLKQNEPELYKNWVKDPINNASPGGESVKDLYERISKDINLLVGQYEGQKIVLISHAGVIRSAIINALGMPIENFWRISIATGSLNRIDYSTSFACCHYMSLCT